MRRIRKSHIIFSMQRWIPKMPMSSVEGPINLRVNKSLFTWVSPSHAPTYINSSGIGITKGKITSIIKRTPNDLKIGTIVL